MKTIDPLAVVVTLAGVPLSGFDDDIFATGFAADTFTMKIGAQGEGCRIRSRDASGKVTFTLMETSDSNQYLSTLLARDKLTSTGVGVLMIRDVNSASYFTAPQAFISRTPNWEKGKDAKTVEWVVSYLSGEQYIAPPTL